MTKYTYNDFGSVTRIERLDGSETLTSVSFFNDMLGTTVGARSKGGRYSAAALTAFGENHLTTEPPNHQTFFTGKPFVEGLGHAFLMRNYRASPLRGAPSGTATPAPKGSVAERRNLRLKPALQAQTKSAIIPTTSKKASSAQGYATSVALATGWRD